MMTQQHFYIRLRNFKHNGQEMINKQRHENCLSKNLISWGICYVWYELWQLCLAFYCDKQMSGVTLNAIYNCSTVSWTRVVTVAQQRLFVQKGWDLARIKHATETHKQIKKSRCFYAFSQWQSIFQATLWGSLAYIERLVKSI